MENILTALRDILGTADFYIQNGNYSSYWDYGAMLEYLVGALILLVTISSIFKFLIKLIK